MTDAAVCEVALQFGGARTQAAKARGFCVLARRLEQARLAQARRGFDENDLAAPLPCLVQGIGEFRELEIAFQQMARARGTDAETLTPWLVDRLLRNLLIDLTYAWLDPRIRYH